MKLNNILVEEEATPHALQADVNLAKDEILNSIKRIIDEDHNFIDDIIYGDMIDMGDVFEKVRSKKVPWSREHDQAVRHLEKMRSNEWEDLFKKKFGKSDTDMIAALQKEGEKQFSKDELALLAALGKSLSSHVSIKDFDIKNEYHLKYYMKSPTKVVFDLPHHALAVFDTAALEKVKMDIPKVVALFDRFKIKASKRPVYKRSPGSMYD